MMRGYQNYYLKVLSLKTQNFQLSEKENLNPESRKFIENVLKGTVKTGEYEHEIFAILEIKKQIKNIENVTLEDIFPEQIYPALDTLIGKKFTKHYAIKTTLN